MEWTRRSANVYAEADPVTKKIIPVASSPSSTRKSPTPWTCVSQRSTNLDSNPPGDHRKMNAVRNTEPRTAAVNSVLSEADSRLVNPTSICVLDSVSMTCRTYNRTLLCSSFGTRLFCIYTTILCSFRLASAPLCDTDEITPVILLTICVNTMVPSTVRVMATISSTALTGTIGDPTVDIVPKLKYRLATYRSPSDAPAASAK
mmetsp:Transcript_15683/g.37814  ORF Transcript_15683/g.37814 Transcript_15683/m.37814 type:complete len:203 (-) Transcript_15683:1358-1966(-)